MSFKRDFFFGGNNLVKLNDKFHLTYDEIRNKKVWRIVKINNLPFVRFSNFSDTDLTVTLV